MKVMVIDDDQTLLVTLKEILVNNGHEVYCFDNAVDASHMSREADLDCIFLDFYMPKYDGVWFMKNANIPKNTKVILITGRVDREVINRMFALGASGYLIKPFSEDDILHQLNFHTGKTVVITPEEAESQGSGVMEQETGQ